MKYMKRRSLKLFVVAALLPMVSSLAPAQRHPAGDLRSGAVVVAGKEASVNEELIRRVRDFLANVPKGDRKTFDDFFADDVIYTRSAGVTVDKAGILKNIDVRAAQEPQATYEADDFTVHPYGDAAVVNFRLVQHNVSDGKAETAYFRNTGTFLKRNGRWQVVAWQATRVPPAETKP
jgi:ketosteroid isomerase-like protein